MEKSSQPLPEAPPSYEASTGQVAAHSGAGGFAQPQMDLKGLPPQPTTAYPQGPPFAPGVYVPATGQLPPNTQPVVVVVNNPDFGTNPVEMTCPHCHSHIRTSIDSEPGLMAWLLAGVLCVVGLWPCACIPCCIDSLNSVTHKCPNCNNFLGRYKGGI